MRTIIAGSRSISDYALVERAIEESGFQITKVISGHARGVDRLGELWAKKHKVPIQTFLPDWERYGKSAGVTRNVEMLKVAEAVIAIWDGKSAGTKFTIERAKGMKLKVYVIEVHQNTCPFCHHPLEDNQHGIDQNDFDGMEYRGLCTYCKYC